MTDTQLYLAIGAPILFNRLALLVAVLRAALQGAQHDALLAQAASVLNRKLPQEAEVAAAPAVTDTHKVWVDSVQHWLLELAQAGFQHLDRAAVAPFAATLQQLQDERKLAELRKPVGDIDGNGSVDGQRA